MTGSHDLAVVVLAGGEGRRIGGGKPLRRLAGETLIERALRKARLWSGDVAVAVRADAQVGSIDARLLCDDPGLEGPLAGVAAAARHAREAGRAGLLTLPCDAPFIPDDLAARLLAGIGDAAAAVAASGGEIHPVCALWTRDALAGLPEYVATGRRSLRGFADHVGFAVVEWAAEPLDPFFNVNRAEDLACAEAILAVRPDLL